MNAQATLTDITASLAVMFSSRKVNAQDIEIANTELQTAFYDAANEYVTGYAGTFEYMTKMHAQLVGRNQGLTYAQVAGVLNCMIAEHRYNERKAAVKTAEQIVAQPARTYDHSKQYVADGYYTVVGPKGGHRTLRLGTVTQESKNDSVKQWLAYLCGTDNEGDYKTVGFVHGNEVTLFRKYTGQFADIMAAARFLVKNVDKLDECGRQYAINSGKCYRCNRLLTTPESVARGLGPICAAK